MSATAIEVYQRGRVAPHLLAAREYRPEWWKAARHQRFISWRIATRVPHGNARMLFNLGPRWGKSEGLCVETPVWFLENWPDKNIIMATATTDLANGWGGRVRDIFASCPGLRTKLKEDSKAKDTWRTTEGGGMKCVGVGKAVLGFGADLLIVDDPYGTWRDGQSSTYRRNIQEWVTGTMESRLNPGGSVVGLHHRMHVRDLTGYLLSLPDGSKWEHYSLPSLCIDPANDHLHREVGEPLDPEMWSKAELEAKERAMLWAWEPMHQQNPEALGNGAIYNHFSADNVAAVELRPGEPIHLAIDFNINPGMHLEIGQHRASDNLFTVCHEIHGPRLNLKAACDLFIEFWKRLPWRPDVFLFGDPAGNQANISDGQSNWEATRAQLRAAGIRTRDRVAAAHPSVIESVRYLNEALRSDLDRRVRLVANPRCERLIADFRELTGDEEGKPDKSDLNLSHASDAVRYWVHFLSPGYTMKPAQQRGNARIVYGPSR